MCLLVWRRTCVHVHHDGIKDLIGFRGAIIVRDPAACIEKPANSRVSCEHLRIRLGFYDGTFASGFAPSVGIGRLCPFYWAGVGAHYKRPDGSVSPDSATLVKDLCIHFGLPTLSTDLARVAQLVEIRKDRGHLVNFLSKSLANLEPDSVIQWLTTFKWRAIFTTNYDRAIERAYELNPNPLQTPVSMSATSDLQYTDPRMQVPIFHLHGTLFGANPSPIVITQTDYARFNEKRQMLWNRLKTEFATSTLFYVGYSGRDPNWQLVLDELTREFYPSELPQSFRLDPYPDELDIELLKSRHIETIKGNLKDFRDQALSER